MRSWLRHPPTPLSARKMPRRKDFSTRDLARDAQIPARYLARKPDNLEQEKTRKTLKESGKNSEGIFPDLQSKYSGFSRTFRSIKKIPQKGFGRNIPWKSPARTPQEKTGIPQELQREHWRENGRHQVGNVESEFRADQKKQKHGSHTLITVDQKTGVAVSGALLMRRALFV